MGRAFCRWPRRFVPRNHGQNRAQGNEGTEKGDRLDVLVTLVGDYEAQRWPIEATDNFDPVDVLHYAIDELGHTQPELAEILGSRSRASEVLARKRALTVEMIHKISEAWKIPADLLVRPYETAA